MLDRKTGKIEELVWSGGWMSFQEDGVYGQRGMVIWSEEGVVVWSGVERMQLHSPEMANATISRYPTGIHSCYNQCIYFFGWTASHNIKFYYHLELMYLFYCSYGVSIVKANYPLGSMV